MVTEVSMTDASDGLLGDPPEVPAEIWQNALQHAFEAVHEAADTIDDLIPVDGGDGSNGDAGGELDAFADFDDVDEFDGARSDADASGHGADAPLGERDARDETGADQSDDMTWFDGGDDADGSGDVDAL